MAGFQTWDLIFSIHYPAPNKQQFKTLLTCAVFKCKELYIFQILDMYCRIGWKLEFARINAAENEMPKVFLKRKI